MVVGDVYVADGVSVVGEGEGFVVIGAADLDVEITNIYVNGAVEMRISPEGGGPILLSLGTITESQFNVGIHVDANTVFTLVNSGVDPVTVAIDGIYTRRPATVFA